MYQAIIAGASMLIGMGKQNEQMANNLYQQTIKRGESAENAMRQLEANQLNIAHTQVGRILSNQDVQANLRKAEAQEKVNAAVHGVEGTTIAQVQSQLSYNAAQATGQVEAHYDAQFDAALDTAETAGYALMSSVRPPFKSNAMKFMMQHMMGGKNPMGKVEPMAAAHNKVGGF